MIRKVYRLRRLWFYYIPVSSTFSVETLRRTSSYNEAKYFAVEVEVLQKQAQPMKSADANARITYANFVRSSVLLLQNTAKKNRQTVEWKIIPI